MKQIKQLIVKPILGIQSRYVTSGATTSAVRTYIAFEIEDKIAEGIKNNVYDAIWDTQLL